MYRFEIFIRCRELPSAHAEYTYSVPASAFHTAVTRALVAFRCEPHVKGRRLSCLEVRITRVVPSGRRGVVETIELPLYGGGEHGS